MAHPALETIFEKRRGVSQVEVRHGYAQAHVSRIESRLMEERLRVLSTVAEQGVSIDFLKLTPTGLSFMVPESKADLVRQALESTEVHHTIRTGRSIVLVYAVNIRDEEGLIAGILRQTITTCARVDHVGDMHDRLLMVVETSEVGKVVDQFRSDNPDLEVVGL